MEINQRIYERLKEVARTGDLVCYSDIAPLADLDMDSQADRTKIGEILGSISMFENELKHPMLSAIVVHKEDGLPGEGFFNLARSLGLHHHHSEFKDMEFFVNEVNKVHGYWKTH